MGYWRSTSFPKYVGKILPRSERYCVSSSNSILGYFYTLLILRKLSFVVDAADREKLEAANTELKNLLEKPQLVNIPVLVLGNKNDLPDALTADELIEAL